MAPPSPRRPGFSRRAQMGLFAGYVVAVFGALLGLLLVITARVDPRGNAAIQTALTDLFTPVSTASRSVVMVLQNGGESLSAYWNAGSKNKAMAKELAAAKEKLIKGQSDALEVARLKRALKMVEYVGSPVITARLVSSTGASSRRFAILGAGANDGIVNGQPVMSPDGLVGRVMATGRTSARVQLIIDADTIVPVKRVSDGLPALAVGTGDGRLELRPLAAGLNPFRARDVFATSGTGGVYRPGIPVAIATTRSRDRTLAIPLAQPARLDFAIVDREYIDQPPPPPTELPREKQ
jgi:rod shape-determining protein MreC